MEENRFIEVRSIARALVLILAAQGKVADDADRRIDNDSELNALLRTDRDWADFFAATLELLLLPAGKHCLSYKDTVFALAEHVYDMGGRARYGADEIVEVEDGPQDLVAPGCFREPEVDAPFTRRESRLFSLACQRTLEVITLRRRVAELEANLPLDHQ